MTPGLAHQTILNHRDVHRSFQTLLQYKLERADTLSPAEKAFLAQVEDLGYSVIAPDLHVAPITKATRVWRVINNAEIHYYNMRHYYAFALVMTGVAYYLSLGWDF